MTARRYTLAVILSLLTFGTSLAQDYNLGWEQVDKSPKASPANYTLGWQTVDKHVDRVAPSQRIELLRNRAAAQAAKKNAERPIVAMYPGPRTTVRQQAQPQPQPEPVPTYNIEVSAKQFYDVYAEKYLQVECVEVSMVRQGKSTYEVLENRGAYTSYPIYLNNLRPGDSYELTVFWDDGSNRTLEKTLGSYVERLVTVDQPDWLAYKAW